MLDNKSSQYLNNFIWGFVEGYAQYRLRMRYMHNATNTFRLEGAWHNKVYVQGALRH